GTLTGPNSIQVTLNAGGEETIEADNIILATGAHPKSLRGIELDGEKVITYKEAILSDKLPARAVIVGGGAIGVEFAYVWANYGVDVTIVEFMPQLLPREDPDAADVLQKAYKKMGIKMYTGTGVQGVDKSGDEIKVSLSNGETLATDLVLMAVGFAPNISGIGLDAAGVELNEFGAIAIDEQMRTNVPSIFAIGDCAVELRLAHVASAMGIVAAEVIAGHPTVTLDYRMMPRATYSQPQVASFGYTEAEAKEAGYEINVGQFPFQPNGRALGMAKRDGFVKIIADARYGEILGAHLVGPDVAELLPELTLAQQAELTSEEIARNVHAHPTLSEVVMEAAHGVEGSPIHI
ncbi:MAG: dihydrolipoyl dehydrogenase, partial [Anaerolineales bacterium]|nr:dihydrolipoyl dehydrogenase [Anaerolineales bacterium]